MWGSCQPDASKGVLLKEILLVFGNFGPEETQENLGDIVKPKINPKAFFFSGW
jgi:hypothetical protein